MSSAVVVSLSEYLAASYRPDRDYIDGEILERNVGEWDHSWLQGEMLLALARFRSSLNLFAVPEQRVQVSPTRFRVPDISVVRELPVEQILTKPPFLCIEILSPYDSVTSMQERIDDYIRFGAENVWILDPRGKEAFWADSTGVHLAKDGVLHATGAPVMIDLRQLWSV